MESRKAKGLFFIGEVLDVTGQTGGVQFSMGLVVRHLAGVGIAG